MNTPTFDRASEDLGNIVNLGHINVCVPDQGLATAFYVSALGLTRDPYLMTGTGNMWINIGLSQYHLPSRGTQVLQGVAGLVIPGREALLKRLASARRDLTETRFSFHETRDGVAVTCPWGNRILCHEPDPDRFGRMRLGLAYIVFDTPPESAPAIGRFYASILGARARIETRDGAPCATISAGESQTLHFRETEHPAVDYDDNHIQIYIADFSGPHARLSERGLISQESNAHQYRFVDLIDPETGTVVYRLDHEVRSMRHPMYGRNLVNRNPAVSLSDYDQGREALSWTTG